MAATWSSGLCTVTLWGFSSLPPSCSLQGWGAARWAWSSLHLHGQAPLLRAPFPACSFLFLSLPVTELVFQGM